MEFLHCLLHIIHSLWDRSCQTTEIRWFLFDENARTFLSRPKFPCFHRKLWKFEKSGVNKKNCDPMTLNREIWSELNKNCDPMTLNHNIFLLFLRLRVSWQQVPGGVHCRGLCHGPYHQWNEEHFALTWTMPYRNSCIFGLALCMAGPLPKQKK
jgi:hypothetical protein